MPQIDPQKNISFYYNFTSKFFESDIGNLAVFEKTLFIYRGCYDGPGKIGQLFLQLFSFVEIKMCMKIDNHSRSLLDNYHNFLDSFQEEK